MSNNPIVITAKPIQLSGTVKGPIVVTPQEGDSGDTTISKFGYNQPTYKVCFLIVALFLRQGSKRLLKFQILLRLVPVLVEPLLFFCYFVTLLLFL